MYPSIIFVLLGLFVSSARPAKALNLYTNFLPFYIFSSPTVEDGERCRTVYESDITGCTDTVDFMNGAFCTPVCEESLRQFQQKVGEACEGVLPEVDTVLERIMQYRLVESICEDGGSGHYSGPAGPEAKKLEGHWGGSGGETTASSAVLPITTTKMPSSTQTIYSKVETVTISSKMGKTVIISSELATTASVSSVVGSYSYSGIEFTAVQATAPFDGGAAATIADILPPTSTVSQDTQTSSDSDDGLSFAAKIGIGAVAGTVLLTIILVSCVLRRRKRRSKKVTVAEESPEDPRGRLLEDGQPGF